MMLDVLTRCLLDLLPLPKVVGEKNVELALCVKIQADIIRCQSRVDAIFVLYANNKYEECLLLAKDVLPRLAELRSSVAQALDKAHTGKTTAMDAAREDVQLLTALTEPLIATSSDKRIKALLFFLDSLQDSLTATKKLFRQYRRQLPAFMEQYAYVRKRLIPFVASIVLVGIFVAGLYAAKQFASFKDLDIRFNWFAKTIHPRVVIEGVELAERDGSSNMLFAWGHGPRSAVAFNCPGRFQFELEFQVVPCLRGESIDVVINGKTVKRIEQTSIDCTPDGPPEKILFESLQGVNTIDFVYSDWNMKNNQYFPGEPRPLSARFYMFSLKRTY